MEGQLADRERMKVLLVEAISTLCRNGLHYDDELSVEGLIGITLDKKDVFLVSVKETFSLNLPATSAVAMPINDVKNGTDFAQKVDSPSSRRGLKRPGGPDGPPPEKHKRKGAAPKQIPVEEIEMINNSPAGIHEISIDIANEDSVSGSDTGQSDRLHLGGMVAGTGTYETNNDTLDHMNDSQDLNDHSDIMFIDPDLAIKREIVKNEKGQNSCMFDASQQPVTRPPPPLHPRPDPGDPRTNHPAGVDPDQLAMAFSSQMKEETEPGDISVYSNPSEIVRMPRSINKLSDHSPVPTSMIPASSLGNVSPGTSGNHSLDGLGDMQGLPIDWGNQSSQEFIQMPGDDSLQESPSQQASSSGMASQQRSLDGSKLRSGGFDSGRFRCEVCGTGFCDRSSVRRHIRTKHIGMTHQCIHCGVIYNRIDNLTRHLRVVHSCGRVTLKPGKGIPL